MHQAAQCLPVTYDCWVIFTTFKYCWFVATSVAYHVRYQMMSSDNHTHDSSTESQTQTSGIDCIDFEEVVQSAATDDETADDSHTEWDPKVFHPSQVGYDEWLILVKKLGLSDMSGLAGTFKVGSMIHGLIQDEVWQLENPVEQYDHIEAPVHVEEDGLVFTGHADIYDTSANVVYDIKSHANFRYLDTPVDRHIDQLHCYIRGLDAEYGQVIYVQKKDLSVQTWPEGGPFTFDEQRWDTIKERCARVRDALYEHGVPRNADEIPFNRPDNYFANSTDLDFSSVGGDGNGGDSE